MLAVALIAVAAPVQAQETGTLRGTVTLVENGDPIDGAVILILGTAAFTFTDDGVFEFTDVPAGSYVVTAQREHLTTVQETVTVAAGATASVDFALSLSPLREEVTVIAEATVGAEATLQAFNAVTTLDALDIVREAPGTIGEALEDEPGIANRSFGPGASRPIVRGFGGDRVHIIEDGIPAGDLSSTSDHHGITIDPHSAERIEITRGPATLLYGSNIVGLINVITPHAAYRNLLTPPESYGDTLLDGTRGRFGADAASANAQVGTYANLQHSRGNLLYWGSGTYRQSGDYDTPEGSVFNSGAELSSGRAGLGYFGDRFFSSLSLTLEDSRFGLPFEDRFHSHGGEDEHDHGAHGHDPEDQLEIDLASQRRVARLDIGVRNIDNSVIQGIRTGFHVVDVQDDHVDTLGGIENIDTRFTNRTYITRTLASLPADAIVQRSPGGMESEAAPHTDAARAATRDCLMGMIRSKPLIRKSSSMWFFMVQRTRVPLAALSALAASRRTRKPELLMKSRRLKSTTTCRSPALMHPITADSNGRAFTLSIRPTGNSTSTSPLRSSAISKFIGDALPQAIQPAGNPNQRRRTGSTVVATGRCAGRKLGRRDGGASVHRHDGGHPRSSGRSPSSDTATGSRTASTGSRSPVHR